MKEYIERAFAVQELEVLRKAYEMHDDCDELVARLCRDAISALPAADVVEVVRCKNCQFFSGRQECYCHAADENGTPIFVRENDFCSYGQRKEAAE